MATSPWGGFNSSNVFNQWDLNPLSQQTGVARDDLANQRDAYLQPLEQQFRQQRGAQGLQTDATSQNLFGNADFQSFAQTGQLPPNASAAQQWNAVGQQQQASPATPTAGTGGALLDQLMLRAQQGLTPSRNDPGIRAQADAFSAQAGRASRNYLADVAEKAGPYANLQGESRMAAERLGQQTGGFEAELLGRETSARRDEIQQALQQWGGMLSQDQQATLQRELAQLSNTARTQDRSQQQDQFLRELALREYDTQNKWDYSWLGL